MKQIRTVVLMTLILLSLNARAQTKGIIFKEDFENYDHNWKLVKHKEFSVKQDGGVLSISKTNENKVMNGCLWYRKTIVSFDASKDFSIKFDANAVSSEYDIRFDIQWGRLQEADGVRISSVYQLDFSKDKVRLSKFDKKEGGWTYYAWSNQLNNPNLVKFSVQHNSFHNYEIIQQGNSLMVNLDGDLVYKIAITPKVGSEIGFQRCLKGELLFDNLVIKQ